MSYKGKKEVKYDKSSKTFQEGAHRHWAGCFMKRGSGSQKANPDGHWVLNAIGQMRLRNDKQMLAWGRENRYI